MQIRVSACTGAPLVPGDPSPCSRHAGVALVTVQVELRGGDNQTLADNAGSLTIVLDASIRPGRQCLPVQSGTRHGN